MIPTNIIEEITYKIKVPSQFKEEIIIKYKITDRKVTKEFTTRADAEQYVIRINSRKMIATWPMFEIDDSPYYFIENKVSFDEFKELWGVSYYNQLFDYNTPEMFPVLLYIVEGSRSKVKFMFIYLNLLLDWLNNKMGYTSVKCVI